MEEIEQIWKQVSGSIGRMPYYSNKQVGCNICTDDGKIFYIDNITIGQLNKVDITLNPMSIGVFHTFFSRQGLYRFSVDDVMNSWKLGRPFMFVSDGFDVFGYNLRLYSKSLNKCRSRADFRKITRKINSRLIICEFEAKYADHKNK